MSEKGRLYVVTERSSYEGSILRGAGRTHAFVMVRGRHRNDPAPWLDGKPFDLYERAVRPLSERELEGLS